MLDKAQAILGSSQPHFIYPPCTNQCPSTGGIENIIIVYAAGSYPCTMYGYCVHGCIIMYYSLPRRELLSGEVEWVCFQIPRAV